MVSRVSPEISVVLPCRNEEASLGECISRIKDIFLENKIEGEIIISDSSTDSSPEIAKKHGVVLVKHDKEGYGRAYFEGFKACRGKYIFCADPDGSYDFAEIPRFFKYLRRDYDFVIGNRFKGKIAPGAMPWLRKFVGNPLLSWLVRMLYKTDVSDHLCGMRAFKKEYLDKLELRAEGMEFASEAFIKAVKNNLQIKELPINYYPRKGDSKLRTFRDGWRHLKFILLFKATEQI